MIDELKQNVETEIEILREISNSLRRLDYANSSERKLLLTSIESLKNSMKLINNSIPKILDEVSSVQKLAQKERNTSLEKIEFKGIRTDLQVTVNVQDREKLLRELSINELLIRKLRKKGSGTAEVFDEIRAPRGYLKMSNRLFLEPAQNLIRKGYFKDLSLDIKKANIDILFSTYVAMLLFTTLLFIFVGLIAVVFFTFIKVDLIAPFFSFYNIFSINRFLELLLIPIILPMIVFFFIYRYPVSERGSLARKIEIELPFAVIHMSAISGSGIEPTQIFKIIGLNREYPYLRKEIRKVLNQINVYGYDLVTALNNVAKNTPSQRLAELFGGLSTTITSGSNLQTFFEKRSETLMVNYRLEREKYTKMAETFMDIYISIVIAAPMILMILLVMIVVLGIAGDISIFMLSAISISVIALLNLIFLAVLHIKQPNY
ncbi:MAG: type II secretion system F family protein [archaeon]